MATNSSSSLRKEQLPSMQQYVQIPLWTQYEQQRFCTDHHRRLASSLSSIIATRCEGLPGVPDPETRRSKSSETDACRQGSGLNCIRWLLKQPDNAYRFCPSKHQAFVERRPSFKQLVTNWKHASSLVKDDHGSFPEVRPRKAKLPYTEGVLSCVCLACLEDEGRNAVKIECEPYAFGKAGEMVSEVHRS